MPKGLDDQTLELQQLLVEVVRWFEDKGAHAGDLGPLMQEFIKAGLRQRHTRVLLTLTLSGPLTVGELAKNMGLRSATASLLVGELDRAGFLDRREDDNDRRRTIVSLPDHIRDPLEQVTNAKLAVVRRTLKRLDPAAREHFLEGLRILASEAMSE